MRPSPRARAAFLLLYGALLAWQIDRWLFTPHGLVSTWAHRRTSVPVAAGSPGGVSQTFTMGADGLDGIWLRPAAIDGVPRGELVVQVSVVQGRARIPARRVVMPATDASGRGSLHVAFAPMRRSRGVHYQVDVRHEHAGDGPAVALAASREDGLPSGRLFADGVEQWGDLVFETSARRATLPYWLHEVLRPWPAWVSAWPTVVVALLAFNATLAWACALAVGLVGADRTAAAQSRAAVPPPVESRAAVTRAATVAVSVIVVLGVAVAARPTGRYRSLDLIDALPDARIETTWPSLHAGVSPEPVVFFGHIHRAIVALPTAASAGDVDVPRGAVLRLGAAMRPDMWTREGDGIQMRVTVDHAAGRHASPPT